MPAVNPAITASICLNTHNRSFRTAGNTISPLVAEFESYGIANRSPQKMNSLRIEADTATQQAEELQAKVKTLENENLAKEQEITSLSHKNGLLESEVEKLETQIKEIKGTAEESTQHSRENETLQRRLQLLEEEAEEADKNLRETNDKCVLSLSYLTDHSELQA